MINRREVLKGIGMGGALIAAPSILKAKTVKKFRMGHIFPTNHPYHLGLVRFGKELEERTDGALSVEVFPSGQIGGEVQILEGMKFGIVDGGAVAVGSIPATHNIQRFNLLDMPYLFENYDAVERFATGAVGDSFRETLPSEAGFHIVGYGSAGFHQILNKVRPVTTPEDLTNMKLRIWEAPGAKLALEIMGASPTPMAYSEAFGALQQGVIDGITNSMTTLYQTKMYEVANYLSLTQHAYVWVPIVLSNAAINSVGKPEQLAIKEAGDAAAKYFRSLYPLDDMKYRKKFEEAGTRIIEADQKLFRAMVETDYERYEKLVSKEDAHLVQLLAGLSNA
jgi:tripartite ATP-independent transporter DctP family solute receptor